MERPLCARLRWGRCTLLAIAVGMFGCKPNPLADIDIDVRTEWVGSPAERVVQVHFSKLSECVAIPSGARVVLNDKPLHLTSVGGKGPAPSRSRWWGRRAEPHGIDWPTLPNCVAAYFTSDPFTPSAPRADRIEVAMFGSTGLLEIQGLLAERSLSVTSGALAPGQDVVLEWSPKSDVWTNPVVGAEVTVDAPGRQRVMISGAALRATPGRFQFRLPELAPGTVALSVNEGATRPTARVNQCRGFASCILREVLGAAPLELPLNAAPAAAPRAPALPPTLRVAPDHPAAARACAEIASDIATLKARYAQLSAFDEQNIGSRPGECSLDYAYHTHPSTRRGGWAAQVPNPDPDGVWFHIAIWDPEGPARSEQLNTQAGFSVFALGDKRITVLTLGGTSSSSPALSGVSAGGGPLQTKPSRSTVAPAK